MSFWCVYAHSVHHELAGHLKRMQMQRRSESPVFFQAAIGCQREDRRMFLTDHFWSLFSGGEIIENKYTFGVVLDGEAIASKAADSNRNQWLTAAPARACCNFSCSREQLTGLLSQMNCNLSSRSSSVMACSSVTPERKTILHPGRCRRIARAA